MPKACAADCGEKVHSGILGELDLGHRRHRVKGRAPQLQRRWPLGPLAGAWIHTLLMAATFGLGNASAGGGSLTAPHAGVAHFANAETKGVTQ
jgi:hypothetical protein